MIGVILWKEYREHRAAWIALAVLAAGILLGVPIVSASDFERPQNRENLLVFGVILTWAYGMICGGMMLAGEREAKTDTFLDTLPGGRGRLWVGKCIAGLVFVAAYATLIAVLVATPSLVDRSQWPAGALALAVAGATGFGWGLYASAYTRTALGAIGLAIAVQFLFDPVMLVVGMLFYALAVYYELWGMNGRVAVALCLPFALGVLLVPFSLSVRVYGRVDRHRRRAEVLPSAFLGDFRRRTRATLWLSARQTRGMTLWLLPLSLALGLLCIPQPLVLWPLVTLVLGTACGVTCFLDEQAGPRRFLGDQRFPLGSIWGMKVGLRLLLLLAALFVAILPLFVMLCIELVTRSYAPDLAVAFSGRLFRSSIVSMAVSPGVLLFAPALTGFAVGMLSGLIFRKAFIAAMTGAVLALIAFGVWVPGLLVGGVPGWQVFLVPVILLVAARLLMRPWAAERLLSRRVIVSMTGLVVSCVLLLGLGLWYRVESIPDTPEPKDLGDLLARLRESEKVETGQLVRSALIAIGTQSREWRKEEPPKQPLPPGVTAPSYYLQLDDVIARGWTAQGIDRRELGGWLDRVFADDVWKRLDRLPELPVGVVIDPRRVHYGSLLRELDGISLAGQLLAARGSQMQQKGDPEVFVKHFEIALALVRNLENDSPPRGAHIEQALERIMTHALEHWLAALTGRADLLRRVGDALDRQGSAWESRDRVRDMAEYLIARNTLDDPIPWLGWLSQSETATAIVREEHLVALVWQLPWEHERQARLLRRYFFSNIPGKPDSPLIPAWPRAEGDRNRRDLERRTYLGVARLRVALRLHQATTGKPATDLEQLVPASIAAIPLDPYDGHPFRYRLSAGEKIEGMPVLNEDGAPIGTTLEIPAGQGILWSVGPDRQDDGGKVFGSRKGDLIYLVPLEKKD